MRRASSPAPCLQRARREIRTNTSASFSNSRTVSSLRSGQMSYPGNVARGQLDLLYHVDIVEEMASEGREEVSVTPCGLEVHRAVVHDGEVAGTVGDDEDALLVQAFEEIPGFGTSLVCVSLFIIRCWDATGA